MALATGNESGYSLRPVWGEPTPCPSLSLRSKDTWLLQGPLASVGPAPTTHGRPREERRAGGHAIRALGPPRRGAGVTTQDHSRQGCWATWELTVTSGDVEPRHQRQQ